jgi:hypothetical protein
VGIELVADLSQFRPLWHSSAACVGKLDVMFSKGTKQAREVCAECSYVAECRAEARRSRGGATRDAGVRCASW